MQVFGASGEFDRILADEALKSRVVITRAVEKETRRVVFAASELHGVRVARTRDRSLAKRLKAVLSLDGPGSITKRESATQRVRQKIASPGTDGAAQPFVNPQPRQDVRRGRTADEFLYGVQAVVQESSRNAADGLGPPAT